MALLHFLQLYTAEAETEFLLPPSLRYNKKALTHTVAGDVWWLAVGVRDMLHVLHMIA